MLWCGHTKENKIERKIKHGMNQNVNNSNKNALPQWLSELNVESSSELRILHTNALTDSHRRIQHQYDQQFFVFECKCVCVYRF